jgi:hypothetical protein
MSQHKVRQVIDKLLADEELRTRFALDPLSALAELHLRGLVLTPDEIDVFVQSGAQLWFGRDERIVERSH